MFSNIVNLSLEFDSRRLWTFPPLRVISFFGGGGDEIEDWGCTLVYMFGNSNTKRKG